MRLESIRKTRDFQDVFRKGMKLEGRMFSLHILEDAGIEAIATGVTIPKRYISSAVKRNYIRRVVNAYFREKGRSLKKGAKIVLRLTRKAQPAAKKRLSAAIREDLEWLIEKAGMEK